MLLKLLVLITILTGISEPSAVQKAEETLQTVQKAEETLQTVQIVFRHGKKTADRADEDRTGLLTNEGKAEMHDLGKLVRERYSDFLKEDYDPAEVKVITSGAFRCIQSGALVAYGLYEQYNLKANWSSTGYIPFDPIPVEPIPAEIDKYLQLSDDCPRRKHLKDEAVESYYSRLIAENSLVQEFLTVCANATNDSSVLDSSVGSYARIFTCSNYIEPGQGDIHEAWALPYLTLYNRVLRTTYYNASKSSFELEILEKGSLFKMLASRMDLDLPQKKIYAYAAHDFTLVAIRSLFEQAMTKYNFSVEPLTASAFFLEVHQLPHFDEPVLKIYFRNGPTSALIQVEDIPGCSPICFVSNFEKIIQPYIPANYDEMCKQGSRTNPGFAIGSLGVVVVIAFAVVVGIVIVMNLSKRSLYNEL